MLKITDEELKAQWGGVYCFSKGVAWRAAELNTARRDVTRAGK